MQIGAHRHRKFLASNCIALDTVPDVIFEYTGNEAIHKKWVKNLAYQNQESIFRWLDAPENISEGIRR